MVALSTTEAEYISLSNGTKDVLWLRRTICELGLECDRVKMYIGNQSAIKLTNNTEGHRITKHIDVRFHFVEDVYERGDIDVQYVVSKEQVADIFTKPLSKIEFVTIFQLYL